MSKLSFVLITFIFILFIILQSSCDLNSSSKEISDTTDTNETIDTINPVINIEGKISDTINIGNSWTDPVVTAMDETDGDITDKIVKSGSVDVNNAGKYEITFSVTDNAGNKSEKIFVVIVKDADIVDNEAPVIIISGGNSITINKGDSWSEPEVTAYDNIDGNVSHKIEKNGSVDANNAGTYEITYTVVDNAGNSASKILTVIVIEKEEIDTTAPVITINETNPMTVNLGSSFNYPSVTAYDDKDGDLTNEISKSGTVNTSEEGEYKITYTVSDAAGNTATKVLTVNVVFSYPTHSNIRASTFWCGEGASDDNDFITNTQSAWDGSWGQNFGLEDHPINIERDNDFIPTSGSYKKTENPFYFALPYNDYGSLCYDGESADIDTAETNSYGRKVNSYDRVYWASEKTVDGWGWDISMCKNRWIKVRVSGTSTWCYAQWEDAGPFYYNDFNYVFGSATPLNQDGQKAGIDLSPSVCLYLDRELFSWGAETFNVDWAFIEEDDVPAGPWKTHITTQQVNWQ